MNPDQDVRWIQRFSNYSKALLELESAIELSKLRPLSKLEKKGLIQCFEYTHELAWKTLKDFMENQGAKELYGSRDVVRESFKLGLLMDGEVWMQMIKSRNITSHIYDEKIADEIAKIITEIYFAKFQDLNKKLSEIKAKQVLQ